MSDFALRMVSVPAATHAASPRWSKAPAQAGSLEGLADATLYYRDDLVRRLPHTIRARLDRSIRLPGTAPEALSSTLVTTVLDALGIDAVHALEGDFAFVVWNRAAQRLVAARDFGGKRSLYYAWHGGALHIATTIRAILADGSVPTAPDLVTIATVGAGLWAHSAATGYTAIREVPAGAMLEWTPGVDPIVRPFWRAPEQLAARRAPLDAAAAELQSLLRDAVQERLDVDRTTAVTLSGGWDSPAVFATAHALLAAGGTRGAVHGISVSYPEGDPGREDELITAIAAHWNATPDFIPVADIPLACDWKAEAARRDQPFAHAYEHWNRALQRRAASIGARVVLDGIGGDQLFQVSDIFLADLFRTLQWGELLRQHRLRSGAQRSWRELYHWAVQPSLPAAAQRLVARLRGHPAPRHYLERVPPIWFRRDFLAKHQVLERDAAERPRLPARPFVLAEGLAYLRFAFYPRVFAHLHRFGREEGVELRSPLLDERIVRFAMARPWSDRVDGLETKNLLRRAMRGLLPDKVLAPRTHRTGTTNAYFLRELRRAAWPVAETLLPNLRLAELGIVDPAIYRRAWDHLLQHDDDELAVRVFFTLQSELWLRSRDP